MNRVFKLSLAIIFCIGIAGATAFCLASQPGRTGGAQDSGAGSAAWFKATKLADGVWCIDDHGNANTYLVTGKNKAMLIDTATGSADLKGFAATLTKLPIIVINTHGHPDHAGGNFQFAEVYGHPADFDMMKGYSNPPQKNASQGPVPPANPKPTVLKPVKQGQIIDLGGTKIEVIETPGHTKGSIVLLDAGRRILFAGDNDNSLVWLFLGHSLPLEVYLNSLESLNKRAPEFDTLMPGHGTPLDTSFISEQITCTKGIVDGSCKGEPYKSFVKESRVCVYKRASVTFHPDNIHVKK